MKPIDLALKYTELFFSGCEVEALGRLLAEDFTFEGPFNRFDSAADYLDSLKSDPPEGFGYKIIKTFKNDPAVCLFYEFTKPGVRIPMAQIFEVKDDKISRIVCIFDSAPFAG